jgi:hypothetical protein
MYYIALAAMVTVPLFAKILSGSIKRDQSKLCPRALCGRTAIADADSKAAPAAFRLGAAAITLILSFLGFLASRLPLGWPFAMSVSLGFEDHVNRT